jgi:cytochrome P450
MAGQVVKLDLASQAFTRNPFPTYEAWHRAGAVFPTRLPFLGKAWAASTHAPVSEVLKEETFVIEAGKVGKNIFGSVRWLLPRNFRVLTENMVQHDNPDHRRLRKLVDQAFSRQSIEGLRGRIESLCDGLLDALPRQEPVDLLKYWARPLPLAVICELMGLPEQDRPMFSKWVDDLMSVTSLLGFLTLWTRVNRIVRYFRQHFEQCRQQPRPGLMTALVQAEEAGDKLSENELLAMAFLLLAAGFETTVHLLSGGTLALLQSPEQKERLLADWSLAPPAVEELLRHVSPVQTAKPRYTLRDVEFHGQALRRGDLVVCLLGAANADPARFLSPEKLDITRSPNPHVAFGSGMHFCLGAQLARLEAQVAFERLFSRYPKLSLAVAESDLKYTGRPGMRALVALPIRLS